MKRRMPDPPRRNVDYAPVYHLQARLMKRVAEGIRCTTDLAYYYSYFYYYYYYYHYYY